MNNLYCCRHCGSPLNDSVIDLGHQPPSNAYLTASQLLDPEITYPLKVFVCTHCWLVQLPAHAAADELFTSDYAYFSSTSLSWCAHAERYVEYAIDRLGLSSTSSVVELASNDGYLFSISNLVESLASELSQLMQALASLAKGIPTIERFLVHGLLVS